MKELRKISTGPVEFLRVNVALSEKNKGAFGKDPEKYIQRFLERQGYVVNSFYMDHKSKLQAQKLSAKTGPVSYVIIVAHVEKPSKYFSQMVKIETEKRIRAEDTAVVQVAKGKSEFFQTNLQFSKQEYVKYLKNPINYMTRFFEKHGHTVNGLYIDSKTLVAAKKMLESGKGVSAPVAPMEKIYLHVREPEEWFSRHILITTGPK